MASWDVIWGNILNALGGAQAAMPGAAVAPGATPTTPGAVPGTVAQSPNLLDASQNANTQAVVAGASAPSPAAQKAAAQQGIILSAQNPQAAQPQPQQSAPQTGLATPPPVAATTAVPSMGSPVGANINPEKGWWDTIMQNISGRDSMGNPLTGEALTEFQRNHALGATLGQLGAALGGNDTWQGRLGQAAYNTAAGGLSAMNAEKQQMNQNDYMTEALKAMTGQGKKPQQEQGPGGPIKQPSGVYTPQTQGGRTGEPAEGANRTNPSTHSLDETLNRMRRLNGGMF